MVIGLDEAHATLMRISDRTGQGLIDLYIGHEAGQQLTGTEGVRGIYVGFESWITGIDNDPDTAVGRAWFRAVEGDGMGADTSRSRFVDSVLAWGRFNVRKGLPFGFELGTWFSVAMVAFAGAAILYDTSNVLHHYPEDRYVAGALQLFASVALMFWYVLRLFMSRD